MNLALYLSSEQHFLIRHELFSEVFVKAVPLNFIRLCACRQMISVTSYFMVISTTHTCSLRYRTLEPSSQTESGVSQLDGASTVLFVSCFRISCHDSGIIWHHLKHGSRREVNMKVASVAYIATFCIKNRTFIYFNVGVFPSDPNPSRHH